jgi:hypothetical protein
MYWSNNFRVYIFNDTTTSIARLATASVQRAHLRIRFDRACDRDVVQYPDGNFATPWLDHGIRRPSAITVPLLTPKPLSISPISHSSPQPKCHTSPSTTPAHALTAKVAATGQPHPPILGMN